MATLDNLLRGALQNRMEALVLKPGSRPSVRIAGVDRDVGQTALDGPRIEALLRELAPPGVVVALGAACAFEHQVDGRGLSVAASGNASGWTVTILPRGREPESPPANESTLPIAERPVRDLDELLDLMLERHASDLHLSSGHRPRLRVHGDLDELPEFAPVSAEALPRLLAPIVPARNREQFEAIHDTDFAYELPGRSRFRVNVFRDHHGAGAVLRTIPTKIPTFEELGLPDSIRKLAYLSKGLVLVTGPTGSGKSTTLAAILDLVNRTRSDHIITIEDPIEFVHPSKRCLVNQREIGVHSGSFKQALRAALREDPDIVLVGEMRDLETIAIAIETAETGHLVFGTLHTSTAPSTIERLVDQFPGDRQEQIRMMLADSLRAVIAQTLLKKSGGGRVAAYEILISTPAISNLVREGKTFQIASAMQTGRGVGMMRQTDALFDLVERKVVEPREAYMKAVDKEGLLQKLRGGNYDLKFVDELLTQS